MTDPDAPPDAERSGHALLRLEAEIRNDLDRARMLLADPGVGRAVNAAPSSERIRSRIDLLSSALEEGLRALGALRADLTGPDGAALSEGGAAELPDLPDTLVTFLRDRAKEPGFSYALRHDEVRGWIVVWKELGEDGVVQASGRLYQRPWGWMKPPASGR